MIKILVVEDSKVSQKILQNIFVNEQDIQIIGIVNNGIEAIDFIKLQKPDVIIMDIFMPKMDGIKATRQIMSSFPIPIIIVSGSDNLKNQSIAMSVLDAGALTVLGKPSINSDVLLKKYAVQLISKVKALSEVILIRRRSVISGNGSTIYKSPSIPPFKDFINKKIVCIGASTGGPQAIKKVLSELPRIFPLPIVIVQHISKGFINGFIIWLRDNVVLDITLASQNEKLLPGTVYFAPDNFDIGFGDQNTIRLTKSLEEFNQLPGINYLFRSATAVFK
ncbi:MAG: response regulator, partial [Candidatus Pacearchaeota archaeon]|nr:response regulator [Candidatus Pacearchaeota archaeon]